jgi:alpha-1,6-mannosyltransferase
MAVSVPRTSLRLRIGARGARRLGWGPLVATATGAELICLGLIALHGGNRDSFLLPAARNAYPEWLHGGLPVLGARLPSSSFGLLMLAMVAAYAIAVAGANRVRGRWPFAVAGAALLLATLAPPLLSGDVFGYLAWARLGVRGIDPYSHAAIAVGAGDPVHPFQLYHRGTSPYGPLFTLASYALAPLGVGTALWVLKAVAGVAALGCVALLARAARALDRPPARGALVFALNPLVLVYAVAGAHNDLLLSAVLAAALLAFAHGRERGAAAGVVLAAGFKASASLALPFLIASARRPRRAVLAALATAAAVAVVALAGFGPSALRVVSELGAQQSMIAVHSGPAELARLLGLAHAPFVLRALGAGLLVAVVLAGMVRVRRGGDAIAATGWAFLVLLLTSAWLLPWYVAWPLPFVALARDRRLDGAVVALTLAIVVSRLPW